MSDRDITTFSPLWSLWALIAWKACTRGHPEREDKSKDQRDSADNRKDVLIQGFLFHGAQQEPARGFASYFGSIRRLRAPLGGDV